MAASDIRGAYELLRRAMQQHLLQQIGDFSSEQKEMAGYDPNNDGGPQGGLPGRLLALQAEPGYRKLFDGSSGKVSSHSQDSNFRRLSRIQTGNRSEDGLMADGPNSPGSRPNVQQFGMAGPTYSQCVDRCLHLLPSPSGDLQSSEFRQCVGKCMGRLR